jgi:hypothetical protein
MVRAKHNERGVIFMYAVIQAYLDEAKIGRKQSYRNLAVFPLLAGYAVRLDYITLDEALAGDLMEVVELSEEGTVPELRVVNKSPKMVLILDGEELVGAKQNRIVNTTILIQGESTTVIPVSCVEQGRWAYESSRFHSKGRLMSAQLRGLKAEQVHRSIRTSDSFRSDQSKIWDEISSKASRMEAESSTMAMSEMYEKKRSSLADYVDHFRLVEMQVGAVFSINGKVVGLDSFGKPETLARVFKKLVESYALDAIDWSEQEGTGKGLKSDVNKFLQAANMAEVEHRPSVGLGMDVRLESSRITGFALAHKKQLLHLSIFARNGDRRGQPVSSRMQRFSSRRVKRSD